MSEAHARLSGSRFSKALLHLGLSALVAAAAAWFVFRLWFPPPFDRLSGGLRLFGLLMLVDVVLGPALTLVAASPGKTRHEFQRDVGVIVLLQLVGFAYGAWSISQARPVWISFEVDRFRVVSAADIDPGELVHAPKGLRELSWSGPRMLSAVKPSNPDELVRSIELGLAGIDLSMVPANWRPYDVSQALRAARPIQLLTAHDPSIADSVSHAVAATGERETSLRFLPIVSRSASWVAVLSSTGTIVAYYPIDGFF